MATQSVCETIMNFEIVGCIRGHHILKNIWTPEIGDVLMCVREPENSYDKNAVALKKCRTGPTIGHISRDLSSAVSSFLCNDVNKATSVVTGKRMNRGTGFGLEVPCVYKFYGEECSIKKLRSTINTDPKSSSSKKRKL